jgi:hypothetical protein
MHVISLTNRSTEPPFRSLPLSPRQPASSIVRQTTLAILGTLLALAATGCQGPGATMDATTPQVDELTQVTLDEILWSDDRRVPPPLRDRWCDKEPFLLGHVVEWSGFESMKRFTASADKSFLLEAEGQPTVRAMAATGGTTTSDGRIRFVHIVIAGADELNRSVEYTLRPRNRTPPYVWIVQGKVSIPEAP